MYLVRYCPTGQIRVAKRYRSENRKECLRELRAMRNLSHPSLPGILDVISQEGAEWLVMEYIPGKCLQEIPRMTFSKEQFFEIAEQLADVLVYLHDRVPVILHLDIKPGNLILSTGKRLVLLDFGAAVMKTSNGETNPCIGTPGFAAPEQSEKNMILDCRADIFGFGAVLNWYLLHMPEDKYKFIPGTCRWKNRMKKVIQKSMQPEREYRYSSSRTLLDVIRRERKNMRRMERLWKVCAAVILLISLLAFAGISLSEEWKQTYKKDQSVCLDLLSQSELLGFAAAKEYYREAASLFPGKLEWCLHLADRIAADAVFELQEELLLKELLFQMVPGTVTSAETILSQQEQYPSFAFRIGMSYWYFYEGSGGKNAAVRWFEKVAVADDTETIPNEWKEIAKLHISIQKYYEQLNAGAASSVSYEAYWADLVKLWKLESYKEEAEEIRIQTAKELISGMVIHGAELIHGGKSRAELEIIIEEIEKFSKQEEEMENMEKLLQEAREALQRVLQ